MRPKDGLYHFETGFPTVFTPNVGTIELKYSTHARTAALSDRYGLIYLPNKLDTAKAKCIEVQYKNGYVNKLVYRTHYTIGLDVCFVVYVAASHFIVATVWLNRKNDIHLTLDRKNYININAA